MVIGKGLIGQRFSPFINRDDVVIFASGVSDSKSTEMQEFDREISMVLQALKDYPERLFVYFSTCSIYDPSLNGRAYIRHKLYVEQLIADSGTPFMIFRLSNVAGPGGNPKTIFHFLANAVRQHLSFQLWMHAYRNLIDVDDVFSLVNYLVEHGEKKTIVNIANPISFHLPEMVSVMEFYFHKKAAFEKMEAGDFFHIDTTLVEDIAGAAGVDFDGDYLRRLLSKYYPFHDVPAGAN